MIPLRNKTPNRRNIVRKVNSYRDHKDDLRIDFEEKCGYCDDHEKWRKTFYEIDHFVPKVLLTKEEEKEYKNLVWACRSCNNAKRKKWPTGDKKISHNGKEGFIDPCDHQYEDQFYRANDGYIRFRTTLGEYMYFALKLHKPQHAFIWHLTRLDRVIEETENLLNGESDKSSKSLLKDQLLDLYREYKKYIGQL